MIEITTIYALELNFLRVLIHVRLQRIIRFFFKKKNVKSHTGKQLTFYTFQKAKTKTTSSLKVKKRPKHKSIM